MPVTDRSHLDFLPAVLAVFDDADCHDSLLWHVDNDGAVHFSAQCSDTFFWASADAEEITEADVPLLRQCLADLRALDAEEGLPQLYAARRRRMRPMRIFLNPKPLTGYQPAQWPEVRELFLACGPDRSRASEG